MHIVPILLFAVSSNMDSLFVGLSYGVKKIHIPFMSNAVIGLISFLGTLFSMCIGKSLLNIIPEGIANTFGSIIIIAIGCYYVIKFVCNKCKNKSNRQIDDNVYNKYDKDKSGIIEWKESFALGFALSLNNMGLGASSSVSGLNIAATSIASFIFSLFFIYISNLFGKHYISNLLGEYCELISGILVILLGICGTGT